jgi:hypothetical protein
MAAEIYDRILESVLKLAPTNEHELSPHFEWWAQAADERDMKVMVLKNRREDEPRFKDIGISENGLTIILWNGATPESEPKLE